MCIPECSFFCEKTVLGANGKSTWGGIIEGKDHANRPESEPVS